MKRIFSIIILLMISLNCYTQYWPRIYGDNINAKARKVIETYDNGMLIIANIDVNNYHRYIWLIKTDINGEVLWEKKIGEGAYRYYINDINQTFDGGFIMTFRCSKYDIDEDPIVLKMDACANIEWCRVLHSESFNRGVRVIQTPDSCYLTLSMYHSADPYERIFLFKLDQTGEVLWSHLYAQLDPGIYNEEGFYLTMFPGDSSYLITGACKYSPTSGTNSMWIKVDKSGNEIYDVIWNDSTYDSNDSYETVHYTDHFCSIGTRGYAMFEWGPTIFKLDNNGKRIGYYRLNDNRNASGANISIYKDTIFVIGSRWEEQEPPFQGHCELFLTDTTGNVIIQRTLFDDLQSPRNTTITYDNKILVMCGFYEGSNWDIYLYKLNQDLQDDTLYNVQLNYDTLCPDSIVSDTLTIDCGIWMDMEEHFTTAEGSHLKIYPNPANEKITVELPVYTISKKQTGNFEVSKVHYGLQEPAELIIYDIFGRKIKSLHLSKNKTQTEINISLWKSGIYLIELGSGGKVLDKGKFVVK
ncbi:MAG: T9SS type A sorting domain-containing protein [Bacteroidales bacterium]|nr:T9SS type A sorting domain-containing protein [Bacteroidales bacterium]MCF8350175.1 T9SS type A sorting domain-containing protein [Bacteroidales bacterium]MCF8375056.1 T9SS type A sorting domain-containing protein [Bacteroidales bacterium]